MPELEPLVNNSTIDNPLDPVVPTPKPPYLIPLLITLFIVSASSLFYYLKVTYPSLFSSILHPTFFKPSSTPSPTLTPSPLPSPRPIPHGPKDFTVSQGDRTVPQFSKGTIDPYDPIKGSTQKITIAIKHSSPISKVTATLKTDHQNSEPIKLKLISGTDQDGVWEGSWTISDSYLYTYSLVLEAIGNNNKNPAILDITLR